MIRQGVSPVAADAQGSEHGQTCRDAAPRGQTEKEVDAAEAMHRTSLNYHGQIQNQNQSEYRNLSTCPIPHPRCKLIHYFWKRLLLMGTMVLLKMQELKPSSVQLTVSSR